MRERDDELRERLKGHKDGLVFRKNKQGRLERYILWFVSDAYADLLDEVTGAKYTYPHRDIITLEPS
jgi:hypothetical protein